MTSLELLKKPTSISQDWIPAASPQTRVLVMLSNKGDGVLGHICLFFLTQDPNKSIRLHNNSLFQDPYLQKSAPSPNLSEGKHESNIVFNAMVEIHTYAFRLI